MQLRDNIINTALLGTAKKPLTEGDFPGSLQETVSPVFSGGDVEHQFLNAASVGLSFIRAGAMPVKMEIQQNVSTEETLPYCSKQSTNLLKVALDEKIYPLVWYWARLCVEKKRIVTPEILPKFFEWGEAVKKYHVALFGSVIGNRGRWLAQFSEQWNFIKEQKEVFDWETAAIADRASYLSNLRSIQPREAIEKIAAVWKEENAANKVELLKALAVNLSKEDESFLTTTLSDKSQKVKDQAWQLLKLIPESAIIESYKQVLRDSIQINKSKVLGLISKTTVQVKLVIKDESIYKSGIDKLSSKKEIADDDYILMQLIAEVPPTFWLQLSGSDVPEIVKLFSGRDELKKFQTALCETVAKFKEPVWAKEILRQFDTSSIGVLQTLPTNERAGFAENFLEQHFDSAIEAMQNNNLQEWPTSFAKKVLDLFYKNNPYYNKAFIESICIYLPPEALSGLEESPRSEQIRNLVNLKEQIKKSFS